MRKYLLFTVGIIIFMNIFSSLQLNEKNSTRRNQGRAFGIFTIVNFPNDVCTTTVSGRNGTCYTSSECTAKGGSSGGSCASSFGVCCIFEKSCGTTGLAENCTYFTSTSVSAGSSCSLEVCKCASSICQLRLDFETFVLSNPVTSTVVTTTSIVAGIARGANFRGDCQTDKFQVSCPGQKSAPIICGTNTGEHMYVAASDSCCTLEAILGSSSTTSSSSFTVKVTQIECSSKRKAPDGCTQYYTASQDTISTYNYQSGSGVHLTNQDYTICVRANRGVCAICYSAATTEYGLSNPAGAGDGDTNMDTNCGNAAVVGAQDYVEIPAGRCHPAACTTAAGIVDRYCGTTFTCGQTAAIANTNAGVNTVCSNQRPFRIRVVTDGIESTATPASNSAPASEGVSTATGNGASGFKYTYWQLTSCLANCP